MQWLKRILLVSAIIIASLYMVSVGFLTYLFSSAGDQPQPQQQLSTPSESADTSALEKNPQEANK